MEEAAVLGGTLALALFTYAALIAGDRWNRHNDHAIRYGVWRGIELTARQRRSVFFNGYAAWVGGTISIQAIASLAFVGIARSVESQFPSLLAYLFLIGTLCAVGMSVLHGAEQWRTLREAD